VSSAPSLTPAQLVRAFGDVEIGALSKSELVDLIAAAEAAKAAASAAQAHATVALLRAEIAERPTWQPERVKRAVGTLVALARQDSPRKGSDHVNLAKSLVEALPCTLMKMAAGTLSERRAALIAKETSHLSTDDRRTVDYEISAKLTGRGDRIVRDQARSTADRIDPDGAERRVRKARKAGFAAVYAEPDGTARVTARMPFEKALAVHRALKLAATDALKDKSETRLIGQIMADVLAERVLGGPVVTPNIEIQLVMNERTLLRGSDEPAEVPGYGPIPGFLGRQLVTDASKVWVRRLFTAPSTGELIAIESKRRIFPLALRKLIVARDRTCRNPWCNAEIKHIDHRKRWTRKGNTSGRNGDGLCARCNLTRPDAGIRADVFHAEEGRVLRLVTPTGHSYDSPAPTLPGTGDAKVTEILRRILDDRRPIIENGPEPEEHNPGPVA
jgi:hypothetical protein